MKAYVILIPFCCAVGSISGQPSTETDHQPEATAESRISVDVSRVNMLFTVSDKKGRFAANLSKSDFEVTEEKRPQPIMGFSSQADLPLRIAVLIDTSNSIRDRFRFQQEAAVEFISSVIRPQDKAAIVSFDTGPELAVDLTGDIKQLAQGIRDLRPGGGTSLYDAIYFASRDLLLRERANLDYRRAMVILSDGDDNQSRYSRDQALEMAHRADATIFCISTNISGQQSDGDKVLRYFSEDTGGVIFFPFKAQDLANSFENIANELRHQYSILYRPELTKADGRFRAVSIKVKERKDLRVRARRGYYAATSLK